MIPIIEYWKDTENKLWYFHLKSPNGGILVKSQGHKNKKECFDAIDLVKSYSDIAPIVQPEVNVEDFLRFWCDSIKQDMGFCSPSQMNTKM